LKKVKFTKKEIEDARRGHEFNMIAREWQLKSLLKGMDLKDVIYMWRKANGKGQ